MYLYTIHICIVCGISVLEKKNLNVKLKWYITKWPRSVPKVHRQKQFHLRLALFYFSVRYSNSWFLYSLFVFHDFNRNSIRLCVVFLFLFLLISGKKDKRHIVSFLSNTIPTQFIHNKLRKHWYSIIFKIILIFI